MSCPENTTNCGCENNPCGCKISSDDIAYQGPSLSCTGIEPCDSMTVAIQKLNDYACGIDLVQNIITNIINNTSLYNQFVTIVNQTVDCDTVFNCLATTTTTTTLAPNTCNCIEISIHPDDIAAATGNSLPQVDNLVFLNGPKEIICGGGSLPDSFDIADTYKYCILTDAIPLLSLYYYKNDGVIAFPDISSVITNLAQDCTQDGLCVD